MKTLLNIALGLALPIMATAQPGPAAKILKQHATVPGYSTAHITHHLFHTFLALADDDTEQELRAVTANFTDIRLLSIDSAIVPERARSFVPDMSAMLAEGGYMKLHSVVHEGRNIQLMVWGENGAMSELALVGDAFVAILNGPLDLEKIVALSEAMYMEGFELLQEE